MLFNTAKLRLTRQIEKRDVSSYKAFVNHQRDPVRGKVLNALPECLAILNVKPSKTEQTSLCQKEVEREFFFKP